MCAHERREPRLLSVAFIVVNCNIGRWKILVFGGKIPTFVFLTKVSSVIDATMRFSSKTPSNRRMLPVSLSQRLPLQLVSAAVRPRRVVWRSCVQYFF